MTENDETHSHRNKTVELRESSMNFPSFQVPTVVGRILSFIKNRYWKTTYVDKKQLNQQVYI